MMAQYKTINYKYFLYLENNQDFLLSLLLHSIVSFGEPYTFFLTQLSLKANLNKF